MNTLENSTENSIKIEDVNNACRFCIHNTRNLISITSKVSNSFEEIGTNVIITVSELITKCFGGLEENSLDEDHHDTPQSLCETCLNKFKEIYEFRKQCVWALNYWETQYNYKIEGREEIEKLDVPPPVNKLFDIKTFIPLEEVCVIESKLSEPHKKDTNLNQLINKNIISCNNNIKLKEKTNICNKIEAKTTSDTNNGNKIRRKVSVRKKQSPRICPYCGIVTTSLYTHMLSHTNSKTQFICDFCGKSFQKRCNLYKHTRIHINLRRYKCKLCTASYVDATSLRVHMLNHTEERKYECNICNRKFKQSNALKYHILSHTLEKKIKCDYCDLLFINNSNKNKHVQNQHLKEYKHQCEFCPKKFHTSSNLSSHRLRHTKYNPYKCDSCALTFIRLYDFNAHNRQHKYNII